MFLFKIDKSTRSGFTVKFTFFISFFLGNAALLLLRSLSGLFLLASNDYDKELRKLQEINPDDFLIHLSTNAEK